MRRTLTLVALMGLSAAACTTRPQEDTVAHHLHCMTTLWAYIAACDTSAGMDDIEAFRSHRDRLVTLGYFQHRVVPLLRITVDGEPQDLHRALVESRPEGVAQGFFVFLGWGKGPNGVELWATPQQTARWVTLIEEQDTAHRRDAEQPAAQVQSEGAPSD